MSIRMRLVLSYIAAIVIPVILSLITAIFLVILFQKNYNMSLQGNHIREMMDKTTKAYEDIKRATSENPENFEDMNYLAELDSQLASKNTGIVVKKGDKIIYSSKILSGEKTYEEILENSKREGRRFNHPLSGDHSLVREQSFYFKNKIPGTVYLITDIISIEKMESILIKLGISLFAAIIIILIATNGVLTYLISKGIIGPLESLKSAANRIKEGDLDFKIVPETKDEIGDLSLAFEEMRCRLKESVEIQQQYENNRKELIASISHDLKTPVTAIKGYVEGIVDGVADSPEKLNKYISTIYSKTSDMDRLIDDLFLFSKLDLKKLPFNFEKIDIEKYLEDCYEELKFDLDKKGIALNLALNYRSNQLVLADREKLKRVIVNVIQNSIKYMDKEDCKIDIRLTDDGDKAVIEIEDNGKGISKEALPLIFDRFYREDPARNTSSGGSGLGLAIAKQIIEEHGGTVWAESQSGKGTSIFIALKKV